MGCSRLHIKHPCHDRLYLLTRVFCPQPALVCARECVSLPTLLAPLLPCPPLSCFTSPASFPGTGAGRTGFPGEAEAGAQCAHAAGI